MSLMNKDIKKIAIVRLSALGDIVNSAVAVQFIKQNYPHATLTWIVEDAFGDILKSVKGIDTIHRVNLKKFKREKSFALLKEEYKQLKAVADFDIIIDMQGLIKSAIVARILGKNTHGFDKSSTRESLSALFYKTTSHIDYAANVIERNTKVVADALAIEINKTMVQNKAPIFTIEKNFELRSDAKNIAFVIGASWESKKYPKEKFAELCTALQEQCYIIWGNEQEYEEAKWICDNSEFASLAPKLTLSELVSFLSHMDLVIGGDTGPTHIAWAQNIASITLLGPTTSRMIGESETNIAIKSPSNVNIYKINKNDFSISQIETETILQKAKELLC
ncbi:Lipopolysaccharide heptosyltransferase I [hydrothermal vent metagenome]|uniref:Lipopolysaccharide heptosyltransferase 1 n=1 Tax=hydrothermal vent metagenome TaxID=652676 RepID=A0A1W1CQF4_9ZZZZ